MYMKTNKPKKNLKDVLTIGMECGFKKEVSTVTAVLSNYVYIRNFVKRSSGQLFGNSHLFGCYNVIVPVSSSPA